MMIIIIDNSDSFDLILAMEALCVRRIQICLGFAFVSEFCSSFASDFFDLLLVPSSRNIYCEACHRRTAIKKAKIILWKRIKIRTILEKKLFHITKIFKLKKNDSYVRTIRQPCAIQCNFASKMLVFLVLKIYMALTKKEKA